MEVEYISFYEASSHALWLNKFNLGLWIMDSIFKLLRIYCDNSTTVFFSNSSKITNANKHIDVKYLTVDEKN